MNICEELFYDNVDLETFIKTIALPKSTISQNILSNLPRNDFRFFGRDKEKGKLLNDLSSDSKSSILRITGIGGIGKTALAIEVANLCEREGRVDAIIWYSSKIEETADIEFSYNNNRIYSKKKPNFEELLETIQGVLNPHPSQHQSSQQNQIADAKNLLSQKRTLLIVDGLETINDEQVEKFIDSVPVPSKVLTTDRRWLQHAPHVQLSGLSIENSIKIIQNQYKYKLKLDEQEQTYLAAEAAGIPFAIKWIINQISSNNCTIESLSKHLLDNRCCSFLNYVFQKSYDQLSHHAKIIISTLALLPVPVDGTFLSQCNNIDEKNARDSFSQLLEHGLIAKKTGDQNFKLVDQIFEMSALAKIFSRYKKRYGEAKLRKNIISFLSKELTSKIYRNVIFSETKKLQDYLDENCELIACFREDLDKNESFNYARFYHARNIIFPRKQVAKEIFGFSFDKP